MKRRMDKFLPAPVQMLQTLFSTNMFFLISSLLKRQAGFNCVLNVLFADGFELAKLLLPAEEMNKKNKS